MGIVGQAEFDFAIFPSALVADALRDSGYKDTDHAIAELIDNSLDAGARHVEVIVIEAPRDPSIPFSRSRTHEIAVADDGTGMDLNTLRRSLRFGDGTRAARTGIGRFGVGLPNSSMSQCRRVDIWTWQNGCDNALRCHLDLDEIKRGETEVSEPVHDPVPLRWRSVVSATTELTGTLVVWSRLDRVKWQGGKKTLQHTARLCGRLYRYYITDPRDASTITLAIANKMKDGTYSLSEDDVSDCKPNDPLYLMYPSSNAPPFHDRPMFRNFSERRWSVSFSDDNGQIQRGEIRVTCSMALADAINQQKSRVPWPTSYRNPGDSPWGKDANRNLGVSIVRGRRELDLSTAWVNNHEPQERWWSVEVTFDPALDEVFGVVNNKQHAHGFVNGAGFDWKDIAYDDERTYAAVLDRLRETDDHRAHLMEVWTWTKDQISAMRDERKAIVRGARSGTRHPDTGTDVEQVGTDVINTQGRAGTTDHAAPLAPEEKEAQITQSLTEQQVDHEFARNRAHQTVVDGRRVLFQSVPGTDTQAFFHVKSVGDVIEVFLNAHHPVHAHLFDVLDDDSDSDLSDRLNKASFSLKMLLIAWARYEDKLPLDQRSTAEDVRMDWGREARDFLRTYE